MSSSGLNSVCDNGMSTCRSLNIIESNFITFLTLPRQRASGAAAISDEEPEHKGLSDYFLPF